MKKWLLYSLYIVSVTAFFIYYLFPSEQIKKYVIFKFANANPGFGLKIDRIKPAFPPGLKFYTVSIFQNDKLMFEAEDIKVMPAILSFFGSETVFSFKSRTCQGIISGKAALPKLAGDKKPNSKSVNIAADLSGIQIKDIKAIQNAPYYKSLSGTADGTVTSDTLSGISAKLALKDCVVGLSTPLFSLGNLTFKTVDADMTMDSNKKIQIKQLDVKGTQASGTVSGSVEMKSPPGKSMLNLTGTIKPHPELIAALGPAALIFKTGTGEKGLPFKIGGTLESPSFLK